MACDRCRGLFEEEKEKRREYPRNRYRSMSEEDRQKLREYKKNRIHGTSQKEFQQLVEQYCNIWKNFWEVSEDKRAHQL